MKVSVITSAYNRADDLVRCIDSVLKSTYTDYEMIVIDNASTDGTSEKLKAKYGDHIQLRTLSKESLFLRREKCRNRKLHGRISVVC